MGMNDDQLTPAEHAAVRQRLLAGARRIEPVGRHRNAWIAGSVAVVLILALAGGAVGIGGLLGTAPPQPATTATASPSPSPTPTVTPTPSISPTPSLTPTEPPPPVPAVAFDGDCSRVLTLQQASDALGSAARLVENNELRVTELDSAAALGGVMCTWIDDGLNRARVTVLDGSVVPQDVLDTYRTATCGAGNLCELGERVGGLWIGVGLTPSSEESEAETSARLLSLIETTREATRDAVAVAEPRGADWWPAGSCEALTPAVVSAIGGPLTIGPGLEGGPTGMNWDIVRGNGLDAVCGWSDQSDTRSVAMQASFSAGIGAPSPASLSAAGVRSVEVAGADDAWILVDDIYGHVDLVAVSGPNRLSLTIFFSSDAVSDAQSVAESLLAQLG